MRVVFKRDALVHATGVVQSLVNPQNTLPILANVLVEASDEAVRFSASDLESCVRCEVAAEVETGGVITLPAKKLVEIVKELPNSDIRLTLDGTSVTIECERIHERLCGLDPEDFPQWPTVKPEATLELPQRDVREIIEKVIFAVPTKDPRKVLLGALFDVKDGTLRTVATDGKKLAFIEKGLPEKTKGKGTSVIVPHKVLAELQRQLADEGTVKMVIGDRQVVFDLGSIVYVSNRIDGQYPNYELAIPKDFDKEVVLERAPLAAAIRRAAVISDERSRSVVMKFAENRLELNAMSFDVGSMKEELAIDYGFEPFELAFNWQFLLEVLRAIDEDKVLVRMNKPISPTIFRPAEADHYRYVVMPIKITDEGGGE
ncbi:MAG: DNA polymerase III subunit beta [Candidatus Sumerlaeia bacterium]|nr:DNA polymerase III subunit beta [Candidatus Sumerlaeia bacterium]